MAKVILINPAYYADIFSGSNVRAAISPGTPPLGLACVAAGLLAAGHEVKILDLNVSDDPQGDLERETRAFAPQYAGVTATTPLIKKAYAIAAKLKTINPNIYILAGGPHPSAMPEEVLKESLIDCVVRGEGDFIFSQVIETGPNQDIPNIFYKHAGQIISAKTQGGLTEDLNSLPFPAYTLLNSTKYHQPRLSSKKSPLAYMETSRGCYGRCIFCNKNICGFRMRMKSPARVVDEMAYLLGLGYKEIHLIDDIFTADMSRAEAICAEILKRGLVFPWYPRGGIRVDRVNPGLLAAMKKAGCYRIPFGVESGSQRVIDVVNKKITLEQAERAVKMAKDAGLETECYFMLALPTETEDDMRKSIDFAVKLDPDYAKFAVTIPLPGTPMFDSMRRNNQLKTLDWSKYTFSTPPMELFKHDILSGETIERYRRLAYRKFYFRPGYAAKTLIRTLKDGTFLYHIKAFFQTRWS